jgi:uncharacterized CHY-type Zn-finger protein
MGVVKPDYKWINPKNRICSTCREEKSKEEFYGEVSTCKKCLNHGKEQNQKPGTAKNTQGIVND